MHPRSFIAGAVVGAVLTALLIQAIEPAAVDNVATLAESDQKVSVSVSEAPDQTRQAAISEGLREEATGRAPINEPAPEAAQAQDPVLPTQSPVSSRSTPVPATEQHRALLDEYADADPEATAPSNNRRELEAEPRDHEWSYFMEQSIGQYLAGHPESIYFDVAGIECRSSICEIQSFGVDENAGPRWGIVVHDLRNQPWNDFGQSGSSTSTIDGRLVILTHLRRGVERD